MDVISSDVLMYTMNFIDTMDMYNVYLVIKNKQLLDRVLKSIKTLKTYDVYYICDTIDTNSIHDVLMELTDTQRSQLGNYVIRKGNMRVLRHIELQHKDGYNIGAYCNTMALPSLMTHYNAYELLNRALVGCTHTDNIDLFIRLVELECIRYLDIAYAYSVRHGKVQIMTYIDKYMNVNHENVFEILVEI